MITIPEFVSMVHMYVPNPSMIIEVGAYQGSETRQLKNAFPSSRIIAIDGDPRSCKELSKLDGVETYCQVIADMRKLVTYFLKDEHPISSIYNRGDKYTGDKCEHFVATTLNDFCKEKGISSIDILKIDAEGATFDVLLGLEEMISDVKIMHIETEDFPYFSGARGHLEVSSYLSDMGFSPIAVVGVVIDAGRQYDSVWIRKEILRDKFRQK